MNNNIKFNFTTDFASYDCEIEENKRECIFRAKPITINIIDYEIKIPAGKDYSDIKLVDNIGFKKTITFDVREIMFFTRFTPFEFNRQFEFNKFIEDCKESLEINNLPYSEDEWR